MSDVDIAYNKTMKRIAHARLVETERVKTTIKQILDNAKTLLGQFKSALQSIRKSVSKSISKSISKRTKTIEKSVRKTLRRLKGRTMSMAEIEGGKKKYKKLQKLQKT